MRHETKEILALIIAEVIENGYNHKKSLDHIQKEFKLNDIQISNVEELISNWNHEIEDKLEEDYEWDTFMDLVINAVNKRI